MSGIENYFAKASKHADPARQPATGRTIAAAGITTLEPLNNLNDVTSKVETSPTSCNRNKLHHNPHHENQQINPGDIDDDDEVVIIEDLCGETRSNLSKSSMRYYSNLNNELSPAMIQSKTDRRIVAAVKTPNVPKIKGSFFNRKYREISQGQLTPTTPKLDKDATPMRNRNRSGNNYHPYIKECQTIKLDRSNRTRLNHDESIVSDYSTPTTTRTLLTPTSMSGSKKRISCLMYKPLELDNESSSESTDSIMRRHDSMRPHQRAPQDVKAIEAPPLLINSKAGAESPKLSAPEKSNKQQSDKAQENCKSSVVAVESEKKRTGIETDKSRPAEDRKLVSECITPPITPEKTKEKEMDFSSSLPSFIPGNCNIDEVLKMYGTVTSDKILSAKAEKESKAG